MNTTLRSGAGLVLLAALTTFSQTAMALGLGNSSVESFLSEPLQAKIDLITRPDDDLESISVSLASAADFELIGASLAAIPVPLRFALVTEGDDVFIQVSSRLAINDPIVRLIVEVNWANGRMLREYTLFLDPPSYKAAPPLPVIDQRKQAVSSPKTPKSVQTAPAQTPDTASPPSTVDNARGGGDEYGPVQSGDTLWRIARNWSSGTNLDLNTVMLAIQNSNPNAFIKGNINLLKRGEILRMPNVDDVRQMSTVAARNEVIAQGQAISQASSFPTAVETPLIDEGSQSTNVAAADSRNVPGDQLELVPPSENADVDSAYGSEDSTDGSVASTALDALRAELSRKEEELVIEQQQNAYLEQQIAEMEERLQSDQDGNVADDDLAQFEQSLREDRLDDSGFESEDGFGDEEPQPDGAVEPPAAQSSIPQVSSSSSAESEESWFSGMTTWLIGLLVVGAAIAGWILSRRSTDDITDSAYASPNDGTVNEIKNEAEEILRVLDVDDDGTTGSKTTETDAKPAVSEEPVSKVKAHRAGDIEDAELLDEDSADPEVRLDLARAYISMGDREAARVILEEVLEHGTEEQQGEAEAMLKEF